MTEASDTELLDRWRAGQEKAGRDLYRRYFPHVHNFFRNKISQESERDDLVASTFEGLLKAIPNFRHDASFKTFVLRIAHNTFVSWVRKQTTVRKVFAGPEQDDAVSVADLARSPFSLVADRREARLLLSALRKLPIEGQELLELFYWEGLTAQGLAEVFEIPEGTVRSRLRTARKHLELAMEKLASSPEELAGTLSNLDGWAQQIREQFGRDA